MSRFSTAKWVSTPIRTAKRTGYSSSTKDKGQKETEPILEITEDFFLQRGPFKNGCVKVPLEHSRQLSGEPNSVWDHLVRKGINDTLQGRYDRIVTNLIHKAEIFGQHSR